MTAGYVETPRQELLLLWRGGLPRPRVAGPGPGVRVSLPGPDRRQPVRGIGVRPAGRQFGHPAHHRRRADPEWTAPAWCCWPGPVGAMPTSPACSPWPTPPTGGNPGWTRRAWPNTPRVWCSSPEAGTGLFPSCYPRGDVRTPANCSGTTGNGTAPTGCTWSYSRIS